MSSGLMIMQLGLELNNLNIPFYQAKILIDPLGEAVTTTTTMDANLNHCLATGKSLTGCLHFVNKTPVDWYSKKQATVETATYDSEFVAAKTATEQIMDIRQT